MDIDKRIKRWILLGTIIGLIIGIDGKGYNLPPGPLDAYLLGQIEGSFSQINRPEGIAFSPLGDLVAVACTQTNAVTIYEMSSVLTMADPNISPITSLPFAGRPHDVSFSPDGNHLAVASRRFNKVMIHSRNAATGKFDIHPFSIIDASLGNIRMAAAVKYHPTKNELAIADSWGNRVSIYRYEGKNYEDFPYQSIANDQVFGADGISFSSDGNLLAVSSHDTHNIMIFERDGELFSDQFIQILRGEETHCAYPHSSFFHPRDDSLVVSCAGGTTTLLYFKRLSADTKPYFDPQPTRQFEIYNPAAIHLQRQIPSGGGVKGLAISPCLSMIGVCASDLSNASRAIVFLSERMFDDDEFSNSISPNTIEGCQLESLLDLAQF